MKKASSYILIFFMALALVSCQSTDKKTKRTPEEIQLSLEILLSDSIEMAPSLIDLKTEEAGALIPESLRAYRGTLPLYDEMEKNYVDAIEREAREAIPVVIGMIEKEPMTIPFTYDYITDKDLTSLMRLRLTEDLVDKIERIVPSLFPETEKAWEKMESECRILKANWDNLRKVSTMTELAVPEKVSDETLSRFILSEAFDAISYAENYLRNRPLTEHSQRSYAIFWEGI